MAAKRKAPKRKAAKKRKAPKRKAAKKRKASSVFLLLCFLQQKIFYLLE